MMNKKINIMLLISALIPFFANSAKGAEIVYPKSNNVTINAERTFFIGSESPEKELLINGEKVDIHKSGGFWHTVNLKEGENIFTIDNGTEVKTFKITREITTPNTQEQKLISYNENIVVQTTKDNVPLRATPVDFGINRLQHFQKNMKFNVIGEYGNFYKVQLGRDDYAWIDKSSTEKVENYIIKPAKIVSYTYSEENNKRIFSLKLNRQTPYILSDNNGLDLVVYNVENQPYNKYEFHINKTSKMSGYKSYFKDDNELVVEVKNFPTINKTEPLKGIKITIDAGHGGSEYGAIGCLGDKEKDLNLAIALNLKDKLVALGADVYMTRIDDSEVSLTDRVKFSNDNNSNIFISIHNNALPDALADKKSSGTETYYFYPQSKELAKALLKSITTETGFKDNGAKQQSFAVVRNTESLAILLELGYIINPDDNAKLLDKEFQNKITDSIIHGLENYLNGVQ